jgi:hypothetical protein
VGVGVGVGNGNKVGEAASSGAAVAVGTIGVLVGTATRASPMLTTTIRLSSANRICWLRRLRRERGFLAMLVYSLTLTLQLIISCLCPTVKLVAVGLAQEYNMRQETIQQPRIRRSP